MNCPLGKYFITWCGWHGFEFRYRCESVSFEYKDVFVLFSLVETWTSKKLTDSLDMFVSNLMFDFIFQDVLKLSQKLMKCFNDFSS